MPGAERFKFLDGKLDVFNHWPLKFAETQIALMEDLGQGRCWFRSVPGLFGCVS